MKQILFYLLIIICLSSPTFASVLVDKRVAKDVEVFIQQMIKDHGFTRQELQPWFANAKVNYINLKKIKHPAEAVMTWYRYRNIFIQQERIDKGVTFWKQHEQTLKRAEAVFGVPAELIVGLIGVETKYGRIKGKFDVFNSLYTLGFHFPRRSTFFRKELKAFLILAREQQWSVGAIKGSYAGAMGYGQFMPSSYRMYAVDFDHDGKINLLDNPVDAIGSVANYIKVHGWTPGGKMIYAAEVSGKAYQPFLDGHLKPKIKIAEFIKAGVTTSPDVDQQQKAVLIELEEKDQNKYWLGLNNFYVISRYNPRVFYTMVVIQLTESINEQYQRSIMDMDN